jgi:hypothetical protein
MSQRERLKSADRWWYLNRPRPYVGPVEQLGVDNSAIFVPKAHDQAAHQVPPGDTAVASPVSRGATTPMSVLRPPRDAPGSALASSPLRRVLLVRRFRDHWKSAVYLSNDQIKDYKDGDGLRPLGTGTRTPVGAS